MKEIFTADKIRILQIDFLKHKFKIATEESEIVMATVARNNDLLFRLLRHFFGVPSQLPPKQRKLRWTQVDTGVLSIRVANIEN